MLQLGQRGADGQFLGADALTLAAARAVAGFFGVREAGRPLLYDGVVLAAHGKEETAAMSTPMGQGIQ